MPDSPCSTALRRAIYKYTGTTGIAILRDLTLKASRATDLNDPFELSPRINPTQFSEPKIRKALLEPSRVNRVYDHLRKTNRFHSRKQFREYYRSTLASQVREVLTNLPTNVEEVRESFAAQFGSNWRIFCASRVPDSILMWSHYAAGHTGMVVELDNDHPKLSGWSPQSHFDVEYEDTKVDYVFDSENVDAFMDGLFAVARRKAVAWSYEKEVRFILPAPSDGGVLYEIEPAMIRTVILGARAEASFVQQVRTELSKPRLAHVLSKRAVLAKDKFALDFAPLEPV